MASLGNLAGKIVGIGGSSSLQKLLIEAKGHRRKPEEVWALFNPSEISRSRAVTYDQKERPQQVKRWGWQDVEQRFVSVEAETLSVDLFFDTYEAREELSTKSGGLASQAKAFLNTGNPFATGDSQDVTKLTDRVVALAEADRELHRPPICTLSWGSYTHIFSGVLTELKQKFTMFLPDGTPVRATMSCTFTEAVTSAHTKAKELWSADVVKTRVLKRGDTLHSIAAEEYEDPSLWRHIARANGITNPRTVLPGTVLTIPKLAG